MYSKMISRAVVSLLAILWVANVSTAQESEGQEILVECPVWEWAPSPIPGIAYELCFDAVENCVPAEIGDAVCIPTLGYHDVWVTAIDYSGAQPVYFDGDIAPITRTISADFDGNRQVGFSDLGAFINFIGQGAGSPGDLNDDGIVGFEDFGSFSGAFGKCVNTSETVYQACP